MTSFKRFLVAGLAAVAMVSGSASPSKADLIYCGGSLYQDSDTGKYVYIDNTLAHGHVWTYNPHLSNPVWFSSPAYGYTVIGLNSVIEIRNYWQSAEGDRDLNRIFAIQQGLR